MGNPAKTIETYAELKTYLEGFRAGKINLLVLVGAWGVGKSQIVRQVLKGEACWIEGNSSALGIYSKLSEFIDKPVVIDDVDSIYSDRKAIGLLKLLCQSDVRKRVAWNVHSTFLKREGIPPEFETSSRVLIIANDWKTLNRNVAAVEDRALMIRFVPSPREVHEQAGTWFEDAEVYEWFGTRVDRMKRSNSFRNYLKASTLRMCGLPWRDMLDDDGTPPREAIVNELLRDESFETMEDRAKAFTSRGGGSRTTFFKYCRKLEADREAAALMPRRKPGRPRKEKVEVAPVEKEPRVDRRAIVEAILDDESLATGKAQMKAWLWRCGGSISTFYAIRKKILAERAGAAS